MLLDVALQTACYQQASISELSCCHVKWSEAPDAPPAAAKALAPSDSLDATEEDGNFMPGNTTIV